MSLLSFSVVHHIEFKALFALSVKFSAFYVKKSNTYLEEFGITSGLQIYKSIYTTNLRVWAWDFVFVGLTADSTKVNCKNHIDYLGSG